MEFCLRSWLKSEQRENRRQEQPGCYDRQDDLEEDVETFVGEKLHIFVSALHPLLITAEDALSVFVRLGIVTLSMK